MATSPKLSVVVVSYKLGRELPRTLESLSASYQHGVHADDYEVLVVDNGSPNPPSPDAVAAYGSNFRLLTMAQPTTSPVRAINTGVAASRGRLVAVMIDGARMLSPGVIRLSLDAGRLAERPVMAVPNWHLGPDVQHRSVLNGYTHEVEDALLASVPWQRDGYELFRIAVLAPATARGIFKCPGETCFLGMTRALFDELGGYDEQFDIPGGGLVNRDTFSRALAATGTRYFQFFGEGTFHQHHGGISTGRGGDALATEMKIYHDQYEKVRQRPWAWVDWPPEFLGSIPSQALPSLRDSADRCLASSAGSSDGNRIGFLRHAARAVSSALSRRATSALDRLRQ